MGTQQDHFVSLDLPGVPTLSSPSSPSSPSAPSASLRLHSASLPGSESDGSGKGFSICDAEQAEMHRNMARLQQSGFREEECGILYASRISLIEVSARENCGCVRVNVWVEQKLHSSQ